ncbi:amino acid ABC-transporter, periplasmic amino acid-binding protein [Treponema primitia ZAS-2]|uniref:Amino acid ABC-transporter, periplasmic amino acid-binding protein n=1 Tax=Treponema primitia (strain ATCC BAA-887 / DSM 12427 / ZAS-2) TaxID=545694 RepID=F5YQT6_TREPZ|nr:transporter substrate-binding domain-containing protein [Treponema primitia]AEF84953.1 amino acid ABC-transporter, periplasmic amino acid-binding protein [Treponema primitia ZAS-2]
MKKYAIVTILLVLAGSVLFAGGSKDTKSSPGAKTIVRVGTEGAYPPYNFVTATGEADGYDVAVVKAIGELLPQYQFVFVPTAWDGIFVALEGGDFDLIASNLGWRKEREEKYYLSTVPYLWGASEIVFKSGRTDIHSLSDLKGKKVAAGVGTSTTTWLEEYIKTTNSNIEIVYTDGNIVNALTEIETGRVDATITSFITTQLTAESLGYKITGITTPELTVSSIHLLFPKTETGKTYQDAFDGALKQLLANGKLAELSRKYFFGKNYTTQEAVAAGL